MKKTMYRIGGYKPLIEPVEVVDETEKTIVIQVRGYKDGPVARRRRKKMSHLERFFNSWQEAKDHLIEMEQSNLDYHLRTAEGSRERLKELKALKP